MSGYKDTEVLANECIEIYRRLQEDEKRIIEEKLKKKYGILLEQLSKEGKAQVGERRKAAKAQIEEENKKAKAANEAESQRLQEQYIVEYKAWQDEVNRLKTVHASHCKNWETEVTTIKSKAETRRTQGLCLHCGGKTGLFKVCKECKRKSSEPISIPPAPQQPELPLEPRKPQTPTFYPRVLEAESTLPDDVVAIIKGEDVFVKLGGIDWRVLAVENNKALLFSEKILESQKYNETNMDITWEQCTLRKYLNNEFYNKLGAVKSAIAVTHNKNSNNQWYSTRGGNDTQDKIFLLSLEEVVKYFGDSGKLKNRPKSESWYINDKFNNSRIAYNISKEACCWWLRSSGSDNRVAASVLNDGDVNVHGDFATRSFGGVRPALWLRLE